MNPWPIYSEMKRHWYDHRRRLTKDELRRRMPRATDAEIVEGMIEFDKAFEREIQYEPTAKDTSVLLKKLFKEWEARNEKAYKAI